MNYITEIRAFYDWLEINRLDSNAVSLWHALMDTANKAYWPEEFTVAISTLQSKTGCGRSALYEARNTLKQKGRLEFWSRGGNQSSVYRIVTFVSDIRTQSRTQGEAMSDMRTQGGTQSRTQSRTQTRTQSRTINKQDETRQNETNKSDGAGGAYAHESELLEATDPPADDDGVAALMEEATQHEETLAEIQALPPAVSGRFFAAMEQVYSAYFRAPPSNHDTAVVFRLLRWLQCVPGKPASGFSMSDDDVFLLSTAFESAANAGKPNLSYVRGVFTKLRQRNIRTQEAYWDYEYQRNQRRETGKERKQ